MKRWRKLISLIAVAGLLVHAWALMTHSVMALSLHLAGAGVSQDLGVICRGGPATNVPDDSEPKDAPNPSKSSSCPLCLGCGPGVALLDEPTFPKVIHSRLSVRLEIVAETITRRLAHLRPPTRGPPLNV